MNRGTDKVVPAGFNGDVKKEEGALIVLENSRKVDSPLFVET